MVKFIVLAAVIFVIINLHEADSADKLTKEHCARWKKSRVDGLPQRCKWMARNENAAVKQDCRLCQQQHPPCEFLCRENGRRYLISCDNDLGRSAFYRNLCKKCQNEGHCGRYPYWEIKTI